MVNEFRRRLLNLSYEEAGITYTPTPMSPTVTNVHNLLFPKSNDMVAQVILLDGYEQIVKSAGLESYIVEHDARIVPVDSTHFLDGEEFNFNDVYSRLTMHSDQINKMLMSDKSKTDVTPDNLWRSHSNPVYRVAGLLVAFVNRV